MKRLHLAFLTISAFCFVGGANPSFASEKSSKDHKAFSKKSTHHRAKVGHHHETATMKNCPTGNCAPEPEEGGENGSCFSPPGFPCMTPFPPNQPQNKKCCNILQRFIFPPGPPGPQGPPGRMCYYVIESQDPTFYVSCTQAYDPFAMGSLLSLIPVLGSSLHEVSPLPCAVIWPNNDVEIIQFNSGPAGHLEQIDPQPIHPKSFDFGCGCKTGYLEGTYHLIFTKITNSSAKTSQMEFSMPDFVSILRKFNDGSTDHWKEIQRWVTGAGLERRNSLIYNSGVPNLTTSYGDFKGYLDSTGLTVPTSTVPIVTDPETDCRRFTFNIHRTDVGLYGPCYDEQGNLLPPTTP